MRTARSPFVVVAIYLVTAFVFAMLDVAGLAYADAWDLYTLPAVVVQVLSLTLIVGTWANVMIAEGGGEPGSAPERGVPKTRAARAPDLEGAAAGGLDRVAPARPS
jgi:hypothetical protein